MALCSQTSSRCIDSVLELRARAPQVHCFARRWALPPEGVSAVVFPAHVAAVHGCMIALRELPATARAMAPWILALCFFYFGFTPFCGLMPAGSTHR